MPEQPHSNTLPSESEIRDILTKMLETTPSQIPLVLLQIQFERLMLEAIDKLTKDFESSIKQLEKKMAE
jgi:plasmid stability protein